MLNNSWTFSSYLASCLDYSHLHRNRQAVTILLFFVLGEEERFTKKRKRPEKSGTILKSIAPAYNASITKAPPGFLLLKCSFQIYFESRVDFLFLANVTRDPHRGIRDSELL